MPTLRTVLAWLVARPWWIVAAIAALVLVTTRGEATLEWPDVRRPANDDR